MTLRYTLDAVTVGSTEIVVTPSDKFVLRADNSLLGGAVAAGQRIGTATVRDDVARALRSGDDPGQINATTLANLAAREGPVTAPASGILRAVGSTAVIESSGIDVVAELSPIQYLRFLSMEFEGQAQVETVLGPRRVRCDALWISPSTGDMSESASTLRCRLPSHVETAPGLRSTLTVAAEAVTDVLLAPNMFIGYDSEADHYFLRVERAGEFVSVPVGVGPTDGVVRVISGDVAADDRLALPDADTASLAGSETDEDDPGE